MQTASATIVKLFTIDGQRSSTLAAILADNAEGWIDLEYMGRVLDGLKVGQVVYFGGGAAAEFEFKRVA